MSALLQSNVHVFRLKKKMGSLDKGLIRLIKKAKTEHGVIKYNAK